MHLLAFYYLPKAETTAKPPNSVSQNNLHTASTEILEQVCIDVESKMNGSAPETNKTCILF